MNEEKEFKKQEYKIELKLVALLSVNDINELKEGIPKLIKKRIECYNYPYLIEKNDSMGSMNMQGYIKCNISEYNEISEEEKAFMNNEVARIKENWECFDDEQSRKSLEIYRRMEKEISNTFNNSAFFKEKLQNTWISKN